MPTRARISPPQARRLVHYHYPGYSLTRLQRPASGAPSAFATAPSRRRRASAPPTPCHENAGKIFGMREDSRSTGDERVGGSQPGGTSIGSKITPRHSVQDAAHKDPDIRPIGFVYDIHSMAWTKHGDDDRMQNEAKGLPSGNFREQSIGY